MARGSIKGEATVGQCAHRAGTINAAEFHLAEHLYTVVSHYHNDPDRLHSDRGILHALVPLYRGPPENIWSDTLARFVAVNDRGLANIYEEHAILPRPLLDCPEILLVLERLESDRRRLLEAWPYELSELEPLQDVWGVPVLSS